MSLIGTVKNFSQIYFYAWYKSFSYSHVDPKLRLDMGAADATLNQGMGLTQKEYII